MLRAASEIPESGHIFPEIASEALQFTIIGEWQERMSSSAQQRKPCVVCAQWFKGADLQTVEVRTLDLTLLRNPLLSPHLLPQSYNLDTYQGAVLYAPVLHSAQ